MSSALTNIICCCIFQGVFVAFVQSGLPAAMAGLRFGDQILQINGQTVAGWDNDKVHSFLKKADGKRIELAVRDRYGWILEFKFAKIT